MLYSPIIVFSCLSHAICFFFSSFAVSGGGGWSPHTGHSISNLDEGLSCKNLCKDEITQYVQENSYLGLENQTKHFDRAGPLEVLTSQVYPSHRMPEPAEAGVTFRRLSGCVCHLPAGSTANHIECSAAQRLPSCTCGLFRSGHSGRQLYTARYICCSSLIHGHGVPCASGPGPSCNVQVPYPKLRRLRVGH